MGRRAGNTVQLNPMSHTPRWVTHEQENNCSCRSSPHGAKVSPTLGSPDQGSFTKKISPPEHLALKVSRAYFWETQRETEPPLLQGAHRLSLILGSRAEAGMWKEPRSAPPADLGGSP